MLLREEERYNIIGAALTVHSALGCGFTEYVYQDALEIEFARRGIPYEREKHLVINYNGVRLKHDFFADFVCYGDIIVECKSVEKLTSVHTAQVVNYLRVSNFEIGVLLNFGEESLRKEVIFNKHLLQNKYKSV